MTGLGEIRMQIVRRAVSQALGDAEYAAQTVRVVRDGVTAESPVKAELRSIGEDLDEAVAMLRRTAKSLARNN